jgi:hypothetical protein
MQGRRTTAVVRLMTKFVEQKHLAPGFYHDDAQPGLAVRVTPKGTRSYVVTYRVPAGCSSSAAFGPEEALS